MLSEEDGQAAQPQVEIYYSAPGFTVPEPNRVTELIGDTKPIFNWGGVKIAKISPDVVVKCGAHVRLIEAKSMLFVAQNTKSLPVPKIFAYYTYGPIQRDVDDYGSLYDTYIFMSYVEGETLEEAWEGYDQPTKDHVTSQLKEYFSELRSIKTSNYIGSVDCGPVNDPMLEGHDNKDPFDSEAAFNTALVDAYQAKVPKLNIKAYLSGMLSDKTHCIVFTHGDLRLRNIMVHNGSVSGIVDWEFSGWYPEYWEFARALFIWRWQHDWSDALVQVLQPYYTEYAVHSYLSQLLW
ncbi:kinase-like protein [Aspergillus californicus]